MNKNILYFKRIYKSNKDFIVRDITSGKRKIYILKSFEKIISFKYFDLLLDVQIVNIYFLLYFIK